MANPDHVKWLLEGVEAWNKRREDRDFASDLTEADLRWAELQGANLQRADLQEADLQEAELQEAELQGANLQRAELLRANLQEVDLQWANLQGAELQGANLQRAELQGADLQEANLQEADLQGANLQGAELLRANLQGADVRSIKSALRIKNAGKADFTFARNLTQDQVNSMIGDTGVLLPDGLVHPDDWPVWEEEDGDVTEKENDVPEAETSSEEPDSADPVIDDDLIFGPRVFLSYASDDRDAISAIRDKLIAEGISCWWDQDIQPGKEWRAEIERALRLTPLVLTFWTRNSVQSNAVKEEAATAQRQKKLTHVRLDESDLPYGFSETQYQNLIDWTGDTLDPRWQRLVTVIKDRLNPPGLAEKKSRIRATGPRTAVVSEGKIDAVDTPPDGKPEIEDEVTRKQIFEEIGRNCDDLKELWNVEPPNTSEKILVTIGRAAEQAKLEDPNWFSWQRVQKQLKQQIAAEEKDAWRGFDRDTQSLIENIDILRRVLKPRPLEVDDGTSAQHAPEIKFTEQSPDDIREASELLDELASDPSVKQVLTERAAEQLKEDNKDLKEGLDNNDNPNPNVREQRFPLWRYALRGIAGFVATAIAILTGTSVNLLTSPGAASVLLTRLEQLQSLVLNLF